MLRERLKRAISKAAFGGVALVGICCLRIPILLSVLTAMGLGFLINDMFLLPLMVLVLSAMLLTLSFDYAIHRHRWPLGLGVISSFALVLFAFAYRFKLAIYLMLAAVVVSRTASAFYRRRFVSPDNIDGQQPQRDAE
ncbi:MAG: MerC domain-containing protein [Rhizomicrobium sp.]